MKKTLFLLCTLVFTLPLLANGQESKYFNVPVNVSLMPEISLANRLSHKRKIENTVSVNLIGGKADRLKGVEWGHVWNEYTEDITGLQIAGFVNLVKGSVLGAQGAGLTNIAGDNVMGFQYAGLANVCSKDVLGFQASGIGNFVKGEIKGLQYASVINIVNKFGKGLQIAPINLANEHKGIPIGLISYIKEVGFHYDVWTDETNFINFGLRSGNKNFHNIIFAGLQGDADLRWVVGAAFAGHMNFSESMYMELDMTLSHINENDDDFWTDELNGMNKLRWLFGVQLNEDMSVYIGPTLNVFFSENNDGSDLFTGGHTEFDEDEDFWIRSWTGLVGGIRF